LSPAGFRIRILFEPTNVFALEHEVHFPQAALGSHADRETLYAKLDHVGVLDEDLPPDID
jgi:hypothetical protein